VVQRGGRVCVFVCVGRTRSGREGATPLTSQVVVESRQEGWQRTDSARRRALGDVDAVAVDVVSAADVVVDVAVVVTAVVVAVADVASPVAVAAVRAVVVADAGATRVPFEAAQ